jgi:threonine aldolase
MKRRAFLATGAALAASPAAPVDRSDRVHFLSDGLSLSPLEYSRLLARLVEEKNIQADSYSLGGAIEKIESTSPPGSNGPSSTSPSASFPPSH